MIELDNINNNSKLSADNENRKLKPNTASIQEIVLEEFSHNGEKEIF